MDMVALFIKRGESLFRGCRGFGRTLFYKRAVCEKHDEACLIVRLASDLIV
jgi:hypothetical protein